MRAFAEDFDLLNEKMFSKKFKTNLELIGILNGRSL